jgi:hypothetical protein
MIPPHPTRAAPARTRSFTLEALDEYHEETLLLHLALLFYEKKLKVRTLNWNSPRNSKAINITLILPIPDKDFDDLLSSLKRLPGVTRVGTLDYDEGAAAPD